MRWTALAGCLVTVGVFFPGAMSPDSLDQLRQANAWTYSTTQPPIMTLLWGLLNLVVAGPALMLVLQAAMWWGGWLLVIERLVPPRGGWQVGLLVVIGLWPPLFAMTGTVWRDVHMTLALLVAVGLLLQDPAIGRERVRIVIAGLLVAYASAVRINAVFSVLPLAGWVVVRAGRAWALPGSRRVALPLGGAIILAIALAGRVVNPALASRIWYPVQNLQVFDLVGMSARTGQNLVPASIRAGNDAPTRIASFYSAFSCFPAYSTLSTVNSKLIGESRLLMTEDDAVLAEIAGAWRGAIRAHPGAYLAHRAAVFAANMGVGDLGLHYPYERGAPPNELDVSSRSSWLSDRAYALFEASLAHVSWLWRPWLYVWASLATLGVAIVAWRRGEGSPATFLVVSSGLLYTLPYLFAAPAADLRYHHWPMASTFLGALLLVARVGLPTGRRLAASVAAGVVATAGLGWAAWNVRVDFGPAAPVSIRAQRAVERGLAFLGRGEWAPAATSFEAAAQYAPYWWVPQTNLGIATQHLGATARALAHYNRGVELDRTAEGARARRATFLLTVGQPQQALADFASLGDPARNSYAVCKSAAAAAAAVGDGVAAAAYSARCLQLDEKAFSRDVIEVSNAFFREESAHQRGVVFFQRLAEVAPRAWWVHANLGLLAARLGQTELANEELALGEALKAGAPRQ